MKKAVYAGCWLSRHFFEDLKKRFGIDFFIDAYKSSNALLDKQIFKAKNECRRNRKRGTFWSGKHYQRFHFQAIDLFVAHIESSMEVPLINKLNSNYDFYTRIYAHLGIETALYCIRKEF